MKKKIGIYFLTAIGIAFIFLPQILSTSLGKKFIEMSLEKKFNSEISIGSVRLLWFGPQTLQDIEFSNPEVEGEIESIKSSVPFWSIFQFGNTFSLKNGFFSFEYAHLTVGPIQAKIEKHEVEATGKASQGGQFTVNGKIYSKTDFDLMADFKGMPSVAIDPLLGSKGMFTAVVGPTFDFSSTLVYNGGEGNLKVDFSSPNSRLNAIGQIAQDTFFLKEPMTATFQWTPELSRVLDGGILEARNPISLLIEPAGTSIPLDSFDIERIEIGNATLNLGQLVSSGFPPFVSLFALLDRAPIAQSTSVIWFTPVHFSMNQGHVHIGRVDALVANAVHLCSWGEIMFPSGNLDLRLGIPADTLRHTLFIQDLSRNYVLQIPVRGTIEHPKYEKKSAGAKIAALVAGQQISNQVSKKTGVLKGLLNQFSQVKEDEEVPLPNRPFPWE